MLEKEHIGKCFHVMEWHKYYNSTLNSFLSLFQLTDFNFGTKNHPIESIYFYSKASPEKGRHISPDKVIVKCSISFMLTTLSHELMCLATRSSRGITHSYNNDYNNYCRLPRSYLFTVPGQRLKKIMNSTHRLRHDQIPSTTIILNIHPSAWTYEDRNGYCILQVQCLISKDDKINHSHHKYISLWMSSNATIRLERSWEIQWTGY